MESKCDPALAWEHFFSHDATQIYFMGMDILLGEKIDMVFSHLCLYERGFLPWETFILHDKPLKILNVPEKP